MARIVKGLLLGAVAGLINLVPLFFAPDIQWTVYAATLITWVLVGFFTATSDLKLPGIPKAILIALLLSLPSLLYVVASAPMGAAWQLAWVVVTGLLLGAVYPKVVKS